MIYLPNVMKITKYDKNNFQNPEVFALLDGFSPLSGKRDKHCY